MMIQTKINLEFYEKVCYTLFEKEVTMKKRMGSIFLALLIAISLSACTSPCKEGHTFEKHIVAPTCTEGGYEIETCQHCKAYRLTMLPSLEHDFETSVVQSTVETEGYVSQICLRCGYENVVSIPALGYAPLSSFLKIGCIGDSLASGEVISNEDEKTNATDLYEYSWGQYIARDYGIDVKNFSAGGATTRLWFYYERGYPLASKRENKCDAYMIGLGINDILRLGEAYLGELSDVGNTPETCKDTYYGNYGKILRYIQRWEPKAKIFLFTIPREGDLEEKYNRAIKELAEKFDNAYLIDLVPHIPFFRSLETLGLEREGHYSALGYRLIATKIEEILNQFMLEHSQEFAQIEFIGTNREWNEKNDR